MQLTPHFTLAELTVSQRAARLGIPNQPDQKALRNLVRMAQTLELVRAALGFPLVVSSGYRSPLLNSKTPGASTTSAHARGLAADFTAPRFGTPFDVCREVMASGIVFDQLIYEYGEWVHIGLADDGAKPRRMVLSKFNGTGYLPGLRAQP